MKWDEYVQALLQKCKASRIPASATFELTPLCNFNCNMCYIHLTKEQAAQQGEMLSTEQWLRIAGEAKQQGCFALELTGGEAATRPDFAELYEALAKMGYLMTLRSNGYLLHGDTLALLAKYKPLHVGITLYGGTDETYRKVCGVRDGFSRVQENVFALRESGINVELSVTETKDNVDDRPILNEWARQHDLFITYFGGLVTPIRSAKRSIDHLRVDYSPYIEDSEVCPPTVSTDDKEKYMSPFCMCRGFGTKFCVSWDGRMTLCNLLPSIWSDVLRKSVGDAYVSLYQQLDELTRPAECIKCQFLNHCGVCPARLLSETGTHSQISPKLCREARLSYAAAHRNNERVATNSNPED